MTGSAGRRFWRLEEEYTKEDGRHAAACGKGNISSHKSRLVSLWAPVAIATGRQEQFLQVGLVTHTGSWDVREVCATSLPSFINTLRLRFPAAGISPHNPPPPFIPAPHIDFHPEPGVISRLSVGGAIYRFNND